MEYGLGIDFGTTYCAAAISTPRGAEICTLGTRAATIPTVVFVRGPGDVLVGDSAERRAFDEPGRAASGFKRRLGDPTPLVLGGAPYGAETLTANVLAAIVEQVSQQNGGPPTSIVLTHPAPYGPYKIDLLRLAAQQADIGPVSFVTEPAAAAVHYATLERIEVGQVVAVYDFGGGTFDAALLRRTADGFTGIGQPEGLERVGGIDLDHAVLQHVIGALGLEPAEIARVSPEAVGALARLRDDCRAAKEALSSDADVTIPVSLPGLMTQVRLTRVEFEAMIRPRIVDTLDALHRAVRSAGIDMAAVDRILLVGGTSRIPLVREMVEDATGRPATVDAHPKHSVALGAASLASAGAGIRPLAPPRHAPAPTSAPAAAPPAPPVPPAPPAPPVPPAPVPLAAPSASVSSGDEERRVDDGVAERPTGRRTRWVVAAAVVMVLVAVGVVVSRGGDDAGDGAGAAVDATAAETDASAADAGGDTSGAQAGAGDDGTEVEPFVDTLPRDANYGNLAFSFWRAVVRTQDPGSFLSGLAVSPDGPPHLYVDASVTNTLTSVSVAISATTISLQLTDGQVISGSQQPGVSIFDPGTSETVLFTFPLTSGDDLIGAVIELGDAGDVPVAVPLDGDVVEPVFDTPLAFASTLTVADADGNTVDWNVFDGSVGFDAGYDPFDLGVQSTEDRRAALGERWLNVPMSLVAGSCECEGINVDTSMVRLMIGDTPVEPQNDFGEYMSPESTLDLLLTFSVPGEAGQVVLRIGPPDRDDLQQTLVIDLP